MDLVTIFYHVDEFCKFFEKTIEKRLLSDGTGKRNREINLMLSEVMTIMIWFSYSGYRTFKDYYIKHVKPYLSNEFPNLVSYTRFVELQGKSAFAMAVFSRLCGLQECTGISYADSASLKVCHIKREKSNRVFKGIAAKGKTSIGWFYGFKFHFVINPFGEIIDFYITAGNVADNNPNVIQRLFQDLFGKIYADKGYLLNPELLQSLYDSGKELITKVRKNMQEKILDIKDVFFLKKRGTIESVIDILKEHLSLEHTRHRSPLNFFAHICSCIMAYAFRPTKPSIAECLNLIP